MAQRTVIDLGQTPIIKSLVNRAADDGVRLAAIESSQAVTLAYALEALRIANEALAAVGGGLVPTINNTDEFSSLDEAQVAGALAAFAEVDAINEEQSEQLAGLDTRLDALEN